MARLVLCHAKEDKPQVEESPREAEQPVTNWSEIRVSVWRNPSILAAAISAIAVIAAVLIPVLLKPTPLSADDKKDTARPKFPQEITNSIGMKFILIPSGEFLMGTSKEELEAIAAEDPLYSRLYYSNHLKTQTPQHRVVISQPFYMGKYEVTQAQWQVVMGENPSRFKGDDRPVESVSWNDIKDFIKKLNEKEKQASGVFCRLPTEAEWEYTVRAGNKGWYHFGDDVSQLGDYAWYRGNSGNETHPVGQKKPNVWGLYDMYGNVREWVNDRYAEDYYQNSPTVDPRGPDTGLFRVNRGGSWVEGARWVRSADRIALPPHQPLTNFGFRCLSWP